MKDYYTEEGKVKVNKEGMDAYYKAVGKDMTEMYETIEYF